ncbi:MAG: mechanosensitive ion channel [Gammaproteobacteria bacterium]|nr:mechanosensitive ion channel [Gammaproteobacteria bacterium]
MSRLVFGLFIYCLLNIAVAVEPTEPTVQDDKLQQTILRLQEIDQSLIQKKLEQKTLLKKQKSTKEAEDVNDIKLQRQELKKLINQLDLTFEQVATGGIDSSLFEQKAVPEFDLNKEIVQITRPVIDSLKKLTEKPRLIEQLRNKIKSLEELKHSTQQAKDSISIILKQPLTNDIKNKLKTLQKNWEKYEADIDESLKTANYQLENTYTEKVSPGSSIVSSIKEFFRERGFTLLVALSAAFAIWFIIYLFEKVFFHFYKPHAKGKARILWKRITGYIFSAIKVLLVLSSVITVFYIRNDLLLLALVILILIIILLNLRNTLPKYLSEIRMLLNLGPVRLDERVIYQGIPMQVNNIGMYSFLSNPELVGRVRIPVNELSTMISRPANDSWFPCREGDFLMLSGDIYAQVLSQSVESVRLKVKGCPVQIPTNEFYSSQFRNLSRDGFSLAVVFGIDYANQAKCLDEVPQIFMTALEKAFAESDYHINSLVVEFKAAAASSLDYLIATSIPGEYADSFFKIERMIQRTCVAVCNEQQWGIPFQQLTIHAGDGFSPSNVSNK